MGTAQGWTSRAIGVPGGPGWLAGIAFALLACAPTPGARDGVVVAYVDPAGAGAQAGVATGDVLLSFERAGALPASPAVAAPLSSCFAVFNAEVEQGPRGPVILAVRRGGKALSLPLPLGPWGIAAIPRDPRHPARAACAIAARGRRTYAEDHFAEAAREFGKALAAAGPLHDPLASAWLELNRGVALEDGGDVPAAETEMEAALALRRRAAPGSLAEAQADHALGYLEMRRDPARAQALLDRALALRSRWAPQGLVRAQTLNVLGMHYFFLGNLPRSQECYRQSLALIRRLRPGTDDEAQILNNLGLLARDGGDPETAERYLGQSARILARIAPRSRSYPDVLMNLGILAQDHGDYVRANQLLREALRRHQELAAQSQEVATILVDLGVNARDLNNLVEARARFEQTLAIAHRLAPGGLGEAEALSNLAGLALQEGRLAEVEALARRALALRERQAPESPGTAVSLAQLGAIAANRGDLGQAAKLLDRALALKDLAPGSLNRSALLEIRGETAHQARDLPAAERFLGEALKIRHRLALQSRWEAETLWELGRVYHSGRRLAEAEAALRRAASALEAQIGRTPHTDEVRARARDEFFEVYRDLVALQVERRTPEAALTTLERSRGRGLLAELAERDLAPGGGMVPALLERQRQLDRRYEGTQDLLAGEDPRAPDSRVPELTARLDDLRRGRDALAAEIRRRSPRYASLRDPQPLDAAGVAAALEPGTVLLAYSIGIDKGLLFAVTGRSAAGNGPRLEVFPLTVGANELAGQVAEFRSLLLRGQTSPVFEAALDGQGRRLYDELVAPAAAAIGRAERLLISPDGALFHLPFGALLRPGEPPSFLAEAKPVHSVLSVTLYSALHKHRRPVDPGSPVVVFADPTPAGPPSSTRTARSGMRRFQISLAPLPGARDEARGLAALFGPAASVWMGGEATESRAKSLPRSLRYLHFATHALLDPRSPLDSALALTASGGPAGQAGAENGLLQAWEIFDLRLDADLVTLSACDTGLGKDAGGEGLIGLTRAFQYAGARSILASLWEVNDRSTALLMQRFYAELKAGASKDVALQRAQLSLLRQKGGRFTHPYHWAAFELIGDWR
jgi:CHAT domain-containing protein/tetratricopeptide (TPR) repeat protein